MNSESDQKKDQRNSNLPPNSATNFRIEETEGNILADSKLSEIEPVIENTHQLLKTDDQLSLPISGAKVLKHYLKRSGLTEYEKTECLDFKQVYFLGLDAEKIHGSKHQ